MMDQFAATNWPTAFTLSTTQDRALITRFRPEQTPSMKEVALSDARSRSTAFIRFKTLSVSRPPMVSPMSPILFWIC